jgi:hypothetical protein
MARSFYFELLFEALILALPFPRLADVTLTRWHQRNVGHSVRAARNGRSSASVCWVNLEEIMVVALLWLNGLGFLGFGLVCLVAPEIPANLVGFDLLGGDAVIEIRAQYGGLFTAIGFFGLWGATQASMQTASAWLILLVYAGLGGGRLLGLTLADDTASNYNYGAMAFELVMTALLGIALLYRRV